MYQTGFEIAIIVILILVNGVFSMSEFAIVSSRKQRLEKWAKEGNAAAATALNLANEPNNFLATIQIGISLIGILTGVYGGATVADYLAEALGAISPLKPFARAIGMGGVVVAITYLSLIMGELVPKRLALINAERIACLVAGPMTWLSRVASPVVRLLSRSTELILTLIGAKLSQEPLLTGEEIKMMIDQGAQAGIFAAAEHDLVKSVLRLGEQNVTALMTPRTDILWLDINDSTDKIVSALVNAVPTRIIVAEEDLDHILGFVKVKQILAQPASSQSIDIKACLEQPLFVPETKSSLQVLEMFKKTGMHMAVVLDEFGGTLGVVTMTDLLKAIVGDLHIPGSKTDMRAVERTDGTWLFDGRLPIDQFKEIMRITARLPDEERAHFQTLGGFVMHQIGSVPNVADEFEWMGLLFRVVNMHGKRVGKVGVARIAREPDLD